MNKKLILATLAGTVVAFVLGWLIYGVLLDSFMKAHTTSYPGLMREMDSTFMILVLLSQLLMALFISFIFQRWAKFVYLSQGLFGGMLLGLFFALSYDLFILGAMNLYTVSGMIVDVIANTVLTGIEGLVIVWVLAFKTKAAIAQ